jgi:AraC-like DNA-binding protein
MLEIFKILILTTIVITLWTAFLLLQDKRGVPILNRWFAVFLLALTTPQIDLYAAQVIPGGIFLLSLVSSTFLWLKGPFIWMFLCVLIRKKLRLSVILLHFAPWLVSLITLLSFPQHWVTISLLGSFHMLTYLLITIFILGKKRRYVFDVWQGLKNTAYYWLMYVVGGLMLLVAIDFIVISLVTLGVLNTYELLDFGAFPLFSVYVLSIGILSVYRPELLFNEKPVSPADDKQEPSRTDDTVSLLNDIAPDQHKIRYLELDASAAQQLMLELTKLMQDKQIYRQNELSLPDLAQALGISVHQVSELLNVHASQSFYEFVNGYRVQYACNLLGSPDCQLRILDIAFEAGFNNKNSFYKIFKEAIGITPNQYREQILKQTSEPALAPEH